MQEQRVVQQSNTTQHITRRQCVLRDETADTKSTGGQVNDVFTQVITLIHLSTSPQQHYVLNITFSLSCNIYYTKTISTTTWNTAVGEFSEVTTLWHIRNDYYYKIIFDYTASTTKHITNHVKGTGLRADQTSVLTMSNNNYKYEPQQWHTTANKTKTGNWKQQQHSK